MAHRLLDDPYVAGQIETALNTFAGRLDAEELAWMRDRLAELLADEPVARELLSQAHPRGTVDSSGERPRPGLEADEPDEAEQAG